MTSLLLGLAAACGGSAPATVAPAKREPAPPAAPLRDEPAWLGVRFDPGTTKVVQVVDRSPAAAAGLELGDEIVSIDGTPMHTSQQIVKTVAGSQPDSTVSLVIRRDGTPFTKVVKLAPRPPDDKLIRDTLLDRPAPPFSAVSLDGSAPLALADLRGNVVLVDFWATWCGPCTAQFPHLNQWHQQYTSKGLRIVALSDEEPDLVREYVAAEKLSYPVALDPDDRIRAAYLVPGMPTTVIIDRGGIVRHVTVGVPDPAEIEAVFTRLLR